MPNQSIGQFKFDTDFLKKTNLLLDTYQEALDHLAKLSNHPADNITDQYGVCNNRYRIRYITPQNIVDYISYLTKAIGKNVINVDDLELLSVSSIEQFVKDNKECVPFEYNTVYTNDTYMNPRSETMEQLVLICRNEYFDNGVYSKSDMMNRAQAIKSSVDLMNGIKFASNVRRLVANIPSILSKEVFGSNVKLCEMFIERFIQTACMINLATCEQLLAYCIPRTSYNLTQIVKDPDKRLDYDYYGEGTVYFSDGIVSESVDLSKNKPVFVNLSHGGNDLVHNSIRKFGHAFWAHSSISFDPHMDTMYTMNGAPFKDDVFGKQKPGFQLEALHSSKYNDILVRVYVMFVPNEVAEKMQKAVEDLRDNKVKYDYKAIWDKAFDEHARKGDNVYKQICSSFVNTILAISGKPLSNEQIAAPQDFANNAVIYPNQVMKLYEGPGKLYDYDTAMEKLTEFAKRESTKVYGESVVTECCMLKTNDMRIRGNIPFNCNMRDVVLQDVHPEWKDTKSAIHFMMNDNRSPIAAMVRKYNTENEHPMVGRILSMFTHFKDPYQSLHSNPDDVRNGYGMHTDVNWLDKITYGNNFLDGNYRSDAMGNNKFSPIEETLDHLYRMFNPHGLKTNEELAGNVYEVACAMDQLIDEYNNGAMKHGFVNPVLENRDMIRDILAILGEILTRSMLKLFHNNMQYISASDDMVNAGGPGYMYTEGFVMEDGEANSGESTSAPTSTPATTPASKPAQTSGQKAGKTQMGVEVKQGNNNSEQSKTLLQKIGEMMKKFANWVATTFAKIAGKFSNDHNAEINWINKNKALNEEIIQALGNGDQNAKFQINLTSFPKYDLQINEIGSWNFTEGVKKSFTAENFEGVKTIILNSLPENSELAKALVGENNGNTKAQQETIQSYILYKQLTPPKPPETQPLTGDMFKGIVDDLLNTGKALGEAAKNMANDLKGASAAVEKGVAKAQKGEQVTALESAQSIFDEVDNLIMEAEAGQIDQNLVTKLQNMSKALTTVSQIFQVNAINTIIRQFYGNTYKMYRDIVTAYKQQSANNQDNAAENQKADQANKPATNPPADETSGAEQPAATSGTGASAEQPKG